MSTSAASAQTPGVETVDLGDKYTYVYHEATGQVEILRHGEPWLGSEPGGFVGSKAWIAAANRITDLEAEIDVLKGEAMMSEGA